MICEPFRPNLQMFVIFLGLNECISNSKSFVYHQVQTFLEYLCICVSAHKLKRWTISRISGLYLIKEMDNMGNISWLMCMRLIELSKADTYLHVKHNTSQSYSSGATVHTIKHPLHSVKHVKTYHPHNWTLGLANILNIHEDIQYCVDFSVKHCT